MSVTNEEVSGPAGSIGGGGSTPPPTSTSSTSTTTTTIASPSTPTGSSIHNGLSSTATSLSSSTFLPSTPAATSVPFSVSGMDDVVRCGYLRKLKGKKKFFVLRKETGIDRPARLEYYDKEKKFRSGQPPKKSIGLKACFNISRTDSKCKYSIALHTHNDCVRIAMSNEDEMNDWLRVMNSLAGEEEDQVDNLPQSIGKPHFEHIWLVTALNKGLGSKENIIGPYRLCLTSKEVTLLKVGEHDGRNGMVKFPLSVIRNVSHDATFGCFFHIELGRLAPTGPGLLSLKTEDNNIAQNMHLLILKAMQNYSKEDLIPRDRESRRHRTYTWNNDQTLGSRTSSFHSSAPPQMTRINSMDGSIPGCRNRIDSVSSSVSSKGFGMSPPVPIMSQTPSFAFNSPLCSTGTDSASSSYSIDYDNNNHHIPQQRGNMYGSETGYSKSQDEDESYVPWNPGDEQQTSLNSFNSLTLPLNPDASDYVETSLASKDSNSTAQTPSSYMEMQSPMSPFDNYMPMSPGCGSSSANLKNSVSGKISVSHSRNSSLIEEHDGYVPMNPTAHTCESGGCSTAGSTTGLDDQYLDMDFGRKLNLSNDDMRHMSPASSESIQSGTPSSDFPLEKVSSYLTDDFDDTNSMRPMRAYSVGSRSDTSSAGKNRAGKNRLEAVQETFRIRAMSVGSKAKRPFTNQSSGLFASPSSILPGGKSPAPPLSSSWSGSTGRWPANKLPMTHGQMHSQTAYTQPMHNHTGSESNDSDLMELDFSHNKSKSRKRSLPGPNGNHTASSSAGSGTSSVTKISPVAKGVSSGGGGRDTPSKSDGGDASKPTPTPATTSCMVNGVTTMPKYASSAPISIQKAKSNDVGYHDSIGASILTKMTGMDLKQLKELDDDGAYLDMDFTNKPSEKANTQKAAVTNQYDISSLKNNFLNRPVVVRPNESPTACKISRFSVNANPTSSSVHDHLSSKAESSPLVRSLSSSSNISTLSNHSNSSSNSSMSVKTQQEVDALCRNEISPKTSPLLHNSDHAAALSRIEECPEKLESRSLSRTPLQSPPRSPHHITTMEDESKVTYAAIEHLPPVRRGYSLNHPQAGPSSGSSCGSSAVSAKTSGVTYAQIDFVKSPETITPN